MIICVCRRLNDQAVREAIRAGARCPDTIQAHHGCRFNCGKCRPSMAQLLEEEQAQALAGPSLVPPALVPAE